MFALNTEVKPITCPVMRVMYGQIYKIITAKTFEVFNVIYPFNNRFTLVLYLASVLFTFIVVFETLACSKVPFSTSAACQCQISFVNIQLKHELFLD